MEIPPIEPELLDELLHFMPLVIIQAVAYITTTRISVERHINLLKKAQSSKQILDITLRDKYRQWTDRVLRTWRIFMAAIAKEDKCTIQMLSIVG